ncbi:hypothetical protein GLOIN_2v1785090 [Rhizophagus irregularis DAOM 181602=DAOM 197198]|nr:hypothetical protein GLOIN_2v1785090 [Rhizophagus irregularis DAOM 181602=DAOM 197198]
MGNQKAARREFVAVLSGLPANTKDIYLAPLVKEHGAKAINIPLSLNSYKPKPWAYVTFNSQAIMDAAIEQTIGFQGCTFRWERFNIGHKPSQQRTLRNNSRSRSRSKSQDHSASAQRSNPKSDNSNNNNQAHLGINPPSTPVVNSEPDRMEEDPPETTGTLIQHPNASLSSGPKISSSPNSTPIKASHSVPVSNPNPSPQDELNSVIKDQKAIKDTLQSLTGSIQGFIASLGGSPSDRAGGSAPSQ